MKKILFNNRYGLETAVIERRKTMTRRIVRCPKTFRGVSDVELEFRKRPGADFYFDCVVTDGDGRELGQLPLPYELGEVVAVGQRYKDVIRIAYRDESVWQFLMEKGLMQSGGAIDTRLCTHAGYDNKMFTRADFMPWQVQITDLWFEHMQDISDEDCLRDGVERWLDGYIVSGLMERSGRNNRVFDTPREAFAALIDRINGRGTWQDNPWVVAYTMDLQRADGFKEQETNK
jgi:hypothetical protein